MLECCTRASSYKRQWVTRVYLLRQIDPHGQPDPHRPPRTSTVAVSRLAMATVAHHKPVGLCIGHPNHYNCISRLAKPTWPIFHHRSASQTRSPPTGDGLAGGAAEARTNAPLGFISLQNRANNSGEMTTNMCTLGG